MRQAACCKWRRWRSETDSPPLFRRPADRKNPPPCAIRRLGSPRSPDWITVYANSIHVVTEMTQDIEDFDGFGAPTELEMWKHQVVLITNEAEYLTRELGKARRNIAKLVAMNQGLTKDLHDLQLKSTGRVLPTSCALSGSPAQEIAELHKNS
jgi:hypothetical protein